MNIVVAYDVRDDDRRARLAALLSTHGLRIQKSVFECLVDDASIADIVSRADELLDLDHDTFHVFHQCEACGPKRHAAGQVASVLHELYWIV